MASSEAASPSADVARLFVDDPGRGARHAGEVQHQAGLQFAWDPVLDPRVYDHPVAGVELEAEGRRTRPRTGPACRRGFSAAEVVALGPHRPGGATVFAPAARPPEVISANAVTSATTMVERTNPVPEPPASERVRIKRPGQGSRARQAVAGRCSATYPADTRPWPVAAGRESSAGSARYRLRGRDWPFAGRRRPAREEMHRGRPATHRMVA